MVCSGHKRFAVVTNSNAFIENYFKIVKQQLHENKMHVLATRFIQKNEPFIRARLQERKFNLTSICQKNRKRVIDDAENATETWKRTRKSRFFTCSKFLSENEMKLQQTPKDFHAVNADDKDSNSVNSEMSAEVQSLDESIDISSSDKSSDAQSSNIWKNQI